MKPIRIAFGVLLLVLCVGTSVTAQMLGDPGHSGVGDANVDSVTLANVNATFDSSAIVSGSFTTAGADVTVTVQVYAVSTDGGVFGGTAAATINATNKMWSGTLMNLKEQSYTFYAIAAFSDMTTLSTTFSPGAITSVNNKRNEKQAKLDWATGFPAGGAKKISGNGTYTAATDGTGTTFEPLLADRMSVYLTLGGEFDLATMSKEVTIDDPAAGKWSAKDIANLKASKGYTAIVVANAKNKTTYNAPIKSAMTNAP